MKLFQLIIDEEQEHLNYFDNIGNHIKELGSAYLARIAGTPSSTGGYSKGFIMARAPRIRAAANNPSLD